MCIRDSGGNAYIQVHVSRARQAGLRLAGDGDQRVALALQHWQQGQDFIRFAGIGPVSYTHLDVYKRQSQCLPSLSGSRNSGVAIWNVWSLALRCISGARRVMDSWPCLLYTSRCV